MTELIDTGTVIKMYLEDNDIKITDLVEASGVSFKTLYRVFNNETKLSYEVAQGINKLIPEISTEFLLSYDTKYRLQIREKEKEYGIKDFSQLIKKYQLKKLYPEISNDEYALIQKGNRIFNFDGKEEMNILFNFDSAKNSKDFERLVWIKAVYYDYINEYKALKFNKAKFDDVFSTIIKYIGTTTVDMTINVMNEISKMCGINFCYKTAIKNSRIRGVVFESDNNIFVFVSDLFKSVERLWVSYIHELLHIAKGDYKKDELKIEEIQVENEEYIDSETVKFFIKKGYSQIKKCDIETVNRVTKDNSIPQGLAAYLVRSITGVYNNYEVNKLIHYYSSNNNN